VLIGDVGFRASSAFGGPCQTPNAERLAAEALKYNRFQTITLCSPSRADGGSVRMSSSRSGTGDRVRAGALIADIVLTITVETTVEALTLGLVVLVGTFLSFSLEIELEGALPWRRAEKVTRGPPG
jgi:3-oxoacyl-ACP reductase-like protein